METLTFGWIGIALAGGAYPVVQIFLDVGMPPLPSRILAALMMSGPAFSLGFVYAGMAATLMVATAWTFAAFARIGGAPIWLASLAGGWTGFLCVLPFARNLSGNVWFDVLLATAMGQVGAAWTAGVAVRRNRRALGIEREPQRTFRIGLRQLFGATTFFCILAAVLGAVSPAPELYQLMAAAALLQANLTLAGLIGARVLSTSDGQ